MEEREWKRMHWEWKRECIECAPSNSGILAGSGTSLTLNNSPFCWHSSFRAFLNSWALTAVTFARASIIICGYWRHENRCQHGYVHTVVSACIQCMKPFADTIDSRTFLWMCLWMCKEVKSWASVRSALTPRILLHDARFTWLYCPLLVSSSKLVLASCSIEKAFSVCAHVRMCVGTYVCWCVSWYVCW